ncbi:XRE family transcriptional regulator [Mesorhizobium sp. M3A.F.Ca.ET.201.01.1.1]|nr:XRE family transcriptional regulator [Mesorhizobium sp. M3A.F.Ca.ET.201.01.1.1]
MITPDQSRAARALLKWSRVRLGAKASLGEGTIKDFEDGVRAPRPQRCVAMRRAFESAGVVFTAEGAFFGNRRGNIT